MNARRRIIAVLVALGVLAIGVVVLVMVFVRGQGGRQASDPSYAIITSPLDQSTIFLNDPVYVGVSAMLSHRNFGGAHLYLDGRESLPDDRSQGYAPKQSVSCSSANADFCGPADLSLLWIPGHAGLHTLSACITGGEQAGPAWKVCSDPVTVAVVDLSVQPPISGSYTPQAGDTLESVAQKFSLPPLLVAVANPDIQPDSPLSGDASVKIPSDPSLVSVSDTSGPGGGPWIIDQVRMSTTQPVDKGYCYYSFGGNFWARVPAGQDAFVYPLDGQLDLTAEFRSIVVPSDATLAMECWGWNGSSLVSLGRGQSEIHPSSELHLDGDRFTLIGVLKGSGLTHPYGGGSPPLKVLPPYGLTVTANLDECINHFPDGAMRGFFGPLFCKSAIESGDRILVWEWGPIFPPPGFSDKIDGYRLYYRAVSSGKLALIKTIPDPGQKVFIHTGAVKLVELNPAYCVSAYLGSVESAPSCYNVSGTPVGLVTVTIPAVPQSTNAISYFTDWTQKTRDDCSVTSAPGLGADVVTSGIKDDEIVVGFEHHTYDCVQMNDTYYRGSILFDLSPIKGPISKANLKYIQGKTDSSGEGYYGIDGQSCADALNISTLITTAGIGAFDPYRALSTSGYSGFVHSVDVTDAVREWMLGKANYGFLFTGRDESFPEENNNCWSKYHDFSLVATYFAP